MTIRSIVALFLIVASLAFTACAGRAVGPQVAPAISYDIADKLEAIQEIAESLNRNDVLSDTNYSQVLNVLEQANVAGKSYNTALGAYYAATSTSDKEGWAQKANAALDTLVLLLPQIFDPVESEEARTNLSQVIGETYKFILIMRAEQARAGL